MENQNPIKSFIYGSRYENSYGRFLPICSSIIDRLSIQGLIENLRQSPNFQKYNKLTYAYRVDEMPVIFITEKKNSEAQFFEGHHSDDTVEGSGPKLLYLLQKLNLRNVFMAVLIQQFNPLFSFETPNYRVIVENSKFLLDELFRRFAQVQKKTVRSPNDLLLSSDVGVKVKPVDVGAHCQLPDPKPAPIKQRPNYVNNSSQGASKKMSLLKRKIDPGQKQVKFLWARCKEMKGEFAKAIGSIGDREIQKVPYYILFDKNPTINLITQLLSVFLGVERSHLMQGFDFSGFKNLQLGVLPVDKLRKFNIIMKTHKKIDISSVLEINQGVGILYTIMDITYRFTRCITRIAQLAVKTDKPSGSQLKTDQRKNYTENPDYSDLIQIDSTI